jgi:hypothetical protein
MEGLRRENERHELGWLDRYHSRSLFHLFWRCVCRDVSSLPGFPKAFWQGLRPLAYTEFSLLLSNPYPEQLEPTMSAAGTQRHSPRTRGC